MLIKARLAENLLIGDVQRNQMLHSEKDRDAVRFLWLMEDSNEKYDKSKKASKYFGMILRGFAKKLDITSATPAEDQAKGKGKNYWDLYGIRKAIPKF